MSFERQGIADHAANLAKTVQKNLRGSLEALKVVRRGGDVVRRGVEFVRSGEELGGSCVGVGKNM